MSSTRKILGSERSATTVSYFTGGATVLLGALLLSAGAAKLVRPRPFAHALRRLLPGTAGRPAALSRVAAPVVGATEVAVGAGLLGASFVPGGWAAALGVAGACLYLSFVGVVAVAVRKGAACGCWSSFSDGPAGGAELGRAAALAVVATLAAAMLVDGTAVARPPGSLLYAAALAAAVTGSAYIGGRILPARRDTTPVDTWNERLRRQGSFLLGRVTSWSSIVAASVDTELGATERDRFVTVALESPTGTAFRRWLGDRAGQVDWYAAVARRTAVDVAEIRRVPCVVLLPPPTPSVRLVVSVAVVDGQACDAVIMGTVDGQPVTALATRIRHGRLATPEPGGSELSEVEADA